MGNTPEYRPWSEPCSWIAFAVMLLLWWVVLPKVIADVLAHGTKTAAVLGQQVAWSIAGLVVLAMLFRQQLRLTVSRGRVIGVLIFSLLWPYFLQGFEHGPKGTDVVTMGVARAEVVLSLVALVVIGLLLGEVIRLPQRSRPWIQWRVPDDPKERERIERFWEEQERMADEARKRNDPMRPGSVTYEADRLRREEQNRSDDEAWRDMRNRLEPFH